MDLWSVTSVFLFAIFAAIPGNETKFINFTFGFEYVYRYEGHVTIKDLGKFIINAKVSTIKKPVFLLYFFFYFKLYCTLLKGQTIVPFFPLFSLRMCSCIHILSCLGVTEKECICFWHKNTLKYSI